MMHIALLPLAIPSSIREPLLVYGPVAVLGTGLRLLLNGTMPITATVGKQYAHSLHMCLIGLILALPGHDLAHLRRT